MLGVLKSLKFWEESGMHEDNTMDYKFFITDLYLKTYDREFLIEIQDKDSVSARQAARLAAQRKAIDKVLVESLLKYSPEIPEKDIWKQIGITHKINVAELDDFGISKEEQASVVERCLSAHQSWIKASGHSFERYISNINNELLQKNEIRFILQSELTSMIKDKLLTNTPEDIAGLKSWGKDFDLYAIQSVHGDIHVFGCIQSKTSIRDRVGRDVTFSNNAMDGLFWSAAVTLDGAFLNMPEFIHMVNGGASYRTNGWHGMYAMSGIDSSNGRIYKVDDTMQKFISHAVAAAKQFISDRRLLNRQWKAD